ncbi:hypothetical protein FKM82_013688 [Ascaphus truei]
MCFKGGAVKNHGLAYIQTTYCSLTSTEEEEALISFVLLAHLGLDSRWATLSPIATSGEFEFGSSHSKINFFLTACAGFRFLNESMTQHSHPILPSAFSWSLGPTINCYVMTQVNEKHGAAIFISHSPHLWLH